MRCLQNDKADKRTDSITSYLVNRHWSRLYSIHFGNPGSKSFLEEEAWFLIFEKESSRESRV